MLDQFNAANISKDAPAQKADASSSTPAKPATTGGSDAAAAEKDIADPEDDADFAKQLEIGMAEMLKELESNPDMAKQFEDMMRQLGPMPDGMPMPGAGLAEAATARSTAESIPPPAAAKDKAASPSPSPSAKSAAKDSAEPQEPNFQDTIRRTMERMRASNASADAASASKNSGSGGKSEDDIMSALLQEITNSAGGPEGDDAFSNMLLGMMEQLTNKEILYEPMKELNDKFPAWLAERKEGAPKAAEISEEERKRFEEQAVHVKAIVERFERPGYKDSNPEDREFIVNSMQKVCLLELSSRSVSYADLHCRCKLLVHHRQTLSET